MNIETVMYQNICESQFTCRNLGFFCKEEEKSSFYKLQWSKNRAIYLAYRLFMCFYCLGWLLADYITALIWNPEELLNYYKKLTVWGLWSSAVYFTLSFTLSVVGTSGSNRSNRLEHGTVKCLRSTTWLLFSIASTQQIIILAVYWGILAPQRQRDGATLMALMTPINIHQHLVVCIMVLIEVFVAAFPIRLLHAIYPIVGGAIYILMTVLVYILGDPRPIYPILNWNERPGQAAGVSVLLCVPGFVLAQSIFFGFYCLRLAIHKRICKRSATPSHQIPILKSKVEAASNNPTHAIIIREK